MKTGLNFKFIYSKKLKSIYRRVHNYKSGMKQFFQFIELIITFFELVRKLQNKLYFFRLHCLLQLRKLLNVYAELILACITL